VWNEVSARLDQIGTVLGPAVAQAEGLADDALLGMIHDADAELRRMRDLLSSDPLTLWLDDRADTAGLDQLLRQAQALATRSEEMARLRADTDRQIAQVARAVAVARASEQDARAVRDEAAQKISPGQLPALPAATRGLGDRLAGLDAHRAAGRWPRLASEIEAIGKASAAAAAEWNDTGQAARALLDRRGEMRGLLDAYRAKASRLGAAENLDLARGYERARDLLWSAPCDLTAASEAMRAYQQAVLALQEGTS
jgi:hypothetical protein